MFFHLEPKVGEGQKNGQIQKPQKPIQIKSHDDNGRGNGFPNRKRRQTQDDRPAGQSRKDFKNTLQESLVSLQSIFGIVEFHWTDRSESHSDGRISMETSSSVSRSK